jgi:hypothetical protein
VLLGFDEDCEPNPADCKYVREKMKSWYQQKV